MPKPLRNIGPLFRSAHMLALNRTVNDLPLFGITNSSKTEAQRAYF